MRIKKNKKAQISMEYIAIVGFVMAVTIPMILIYHNYSGQTRDEIISNQVSQIAKKLVDSAESVYYLGEPSKNTLKVYFPNNIQQITIGNKELVFRIRTRNGLDDIVVVSHVELNGSLSVSSGIHHIKLESKGDYVLISE